jgi:hypothetical protein
MSARLNPAVRKAKKMPDDATSTTSNNSNRILAHFIKRKEYDMERDARLRRFEEEHIQKIEAELAKCQKNLASSQENVAELQAWKDERLAADRRKSQQKSGDDGPNANGDFNGGYRPS